MTRFPRSKQKVLAGFYLEPVKCWHPCLACTFILPLAQRAERPPGPRWPEVMPGLIGSFGGLAVSARCFLGPESWAARLQNLLTTRARLASPCCRAAPGLASVRHGLCRCPSLSFPEAANPAPRNCLHPKPRAPGTDVHTFPPRHPRQSPLPTVTGNRPTPSSLGVSSL